MALQKKGILSFKMFKNINLGSLDNQKIYGSSVPKAFKRPLSLGASHFRLEAKLDSQRARSFATRNVEEDQNEEGDSKKE